MRLLSAKKLGTKNTYRPSIPNSTHIQPNAFILPEDVMGVGILRGSYGTLEKKNPKILSQLKVTKKILRRPYI